MVKQTLSCGFQNATILEINLDSNLQHDKFELRIFSVDTLALWLGSSRTYIFNVLRDQSELSEITFFRPSDKLKRLPLKYLLYYIAGRPYFVSLLEK